MTLICSQRFSTPLGPMYVSATDQGVCLLEFARAERIERESRDLEKRLRARTVLRENEHTRQAAREIAEYFQGAVMLSTSPCTPRAPISSDGSGLNWARFRLATPPTIRPWPNVSGVPMPCARWGRPSARTG